MTEELDIDEVEKLFSVFEYHLEKCSENEQENDDLVLYSVKDRDGNQVKCSFIWEMGCGSAYRHADVLDFIRLDQLRIILKYSENFWIEKKMSIDSQPRLTSASILTKCQNNIFYNKSPHEMLVMYDLSHCHE